VDASDNILLAAQFQFTVSFGTVSVSAPGGMNIALAKLRPTDGSTIWAKAYGNSLIDTPNALAVDRSGDVVVTGQNYGASDLGGGIIGSGGIFVAKYSGVDGSYSWAKALGGATGYGIATDPATGNVFIAGDKAGIYVAAFDPSGSSLWTKTYGGNGDSGRAICVDANGNLAFAGQASHAIDFTGTGVYTTGRGYIAASFKVSGNSQPTFAWARRTNAASAGSGAAFDYNGHLFITGTFQSSTVDFGGVSATAPLGTTDGFVVQYNR